MTTVDQEARAHLDRLRGGLVVSCQADAATPLHGPLFMSAMARAALLGGAAGIRADGAADVGAIHAALGPGVPIIGIAKAKRPDGSLFITPTADSARAVIAAGARLVALDGTPRPRPGGEMLAAVVGTLDDGRHAIADGVDAVGTTLSGYTPDSPRLDDPDFDLLAGLVAECPVPVFAEGRIRTPEEARRALALGAAFVVVGTAITNPTAITERFVAALGG